MSRGDLSHDCTHARSTFYCAEPETFEGDHNGQVGLSFETKVLPFFSQQLSFGER
jgi:hypothetical protein